LAAALLPIGRLLNRHRGVARTAAAGIALSVAAALSLQDATTQAVLPTPPALPDAPASILPRNVGIGIRSTDAVSIAFDAPMDRASVEAALQLLPAQRYTAEWSADSTSLSLRAERRWRTDHRYLVVVGGSATRTDGTQVGTVQRFAFTTQTAPYVTDIQVRLAGLDLQPLPTTPHASDDPVLSLETTESSSGAALPPTATATDVSARTTITFSFSGPMDQADVEHRFAITPQVAGDLTWAQGELVFRPTERLQPGARYTVSVVGAHDAMGNVLGGQANFSFLVRPGAQLISTSPALDEADVEPSQVVMWFSQPMNTGAVASALRVVDTSSGETLAGEVSWNLEHTQLTFTPASPFAAGRTIEVQLAEAATDLDGNSVARTWSFTTKPPPEPTIREAPPVPRVVVPRPAPASNLEEYALNQVNAARAAYGFAPLVLDAGISAVAYAHAYDQAINNYFSHFSLDGRTREDRLRAGGVAFSYSGENQCYLVGRSLEATLDWCHAQFMAEPYPGEWNHIANILDPRFTRMGVGIAQVGGKVVVTWNFTN
jgi:uncharacterized protein YkwD